DDGAAGRRERLALLAALAAALLTRPLRPFEHALLEQALAAVTSKVVVVGQVVDALLDPSAEMARALRAPLEVLRGESRDVAFSLRRLVHGELAGLFDGPTSDR